MFFNFGIPLGFSLVSISFAGTPIIVVFSLVVFLITTEPVPTIVFLLILTLGLKEAEEPIKE